MDIKVYTGEHCFKCKELKQFLEDNKIKYEEYDINETTELAQLIVTESGYQTLPIINIDGEWYSGFGSVVKNILIKKSE